MTSEEKSVIFASSLGTVFEWYDFYLFGVMSAIIAANFFTALDPATRDLKKRPATAKPVVSETAAKLLKSVHYEGFRYSLTFSSAELAPCDIGKTQDNIGGFLREFRGRWTRGRDRSKAG